MSAARPTAQTHGPARAAQAIQLCGGAAAVETAAAAQLASGAAGGGGGAPPLLAALHCNLAACELRARRWGAAVDACDAALRVWPRYTKARADIVVGKGEQALS